MEADADLGGLKIERRRPTSYKGRRLAGKLFWLGLVALGGAVWLGVTYGRGPLVGLEPVIRASALAASGDGDEGGWTELNAAGYVVADRQSTVAAKYNARLLVLHVRESQKVKQGDLLAELDHRELDAQIGQARADVDQAGAQVQQAAAQIEWAAAQVDQAKQSVVQAKAEAAAARAPLETLAAAVREQEVMVADARRRLAKDAALAKQGAGAATAAEDREAEVWMMEARLAAAQGRRVEAERQVEVAAARVGSAEAAVRTAQAQVKSSEAARDAAAALQRSREAWVKVLEAQREDYFVRAPFAGVITARIAEEGEIVAPVSVGGTMAKGAIVTVAAWDSLQAEVDVAEAYLERVKAGGRAAITVDAIPNRTFAGKVQRILPRADRSKATVQVRVDFIDRDGVFLPDMGVRVKFLPDDAPEGAERGLVPDPLLVPASAVREDGGAAFVWTAKDGSAKRVTVELGPATGAWREVRKGLELGQRVVTAGAAEIREDGQAVRVKEVP